MDLFDVEAVERVTLGEHRDVEPPDPAPRRGPLDIPPPPPVRLVGRRRIDLLVGGGGRK